MSVDSLLRYKWLWDPVIRRYSIPPRSTRILYEREGVGYVHYISLLTDSKDTTFNLLLEAENPVEISATPKDLYSKSLLDYTDKEMWLSVYDTVDNVFLLHYTPTGLGTPFRGKNRMSVTNPTDNTVNVELKALILYYRTRGGRRGLIRR